MLKKAKDLEIDDVVEYMNAEYVVSEVEVVGKDTFVVFEGYGYEVQLKSKDELYVKDKCPHCDVTLEYKMFDVDGTNLQEYPVCPECGYGSPSLK